MFKINELILTIILEFEYFSGNIDKTEVKFGRTSRGNESLELNRKQFTLNRRRGNICYWECVKRRNKQSHCICRVVTVNKDVKKITGTHNHP